MKTKSTATGSAQPAPTGTIRVGVGGWTFEPWRGVFFPADLAHTKELEYASTHLTTIEINGTFYRTQSPATFAKWAKGTPEGFVFSVKALRYTTNRTALSEAGDSVSRFLSSGLVELGAKLGPILWQFAPTKRFDPVDFGAFLKLLPDRQDGVRLRHAVEVRHASFIDPAFVELARAHGAAIVYTDAAKHPSIPDPTGDFIYARLQDAREELETGYSEADLDRWAGVTRAWASGQPAGLPNVSDVPAAAKARDVFVFMINGAKVRAPAAALGLLRRISDM